MGPPVSVRFAHVFNYNTASAVWHADAPGVLTVINSLSSFAQSSRVVPEFHLHKGFFVCDLPFQQHPEPMDKPVPCRSSQSSFVNLSFQRGARRKGLSAVPDAQQVLVAQPPGLPVCSATPY